MLGFDRGTAKIAAEQVDHFDEIYGGTQVSGCFWRFPDRERPYNLFTSSDVLRQTAKKLNLPRSPSPQRTMLTSETEIKGENAKTITVFMHIRIVWLICVSARKAGLNGLQQTMNLI